MFDKPFDVTLFWFAFLLYLGAFLCFSVYGATRGRRLGRFATAVLGVGFVLQTLGIVGRWRTAGYVPMSNMFEYASLLSWMAVLSYLFIAVQYRKTIVGTFVSPVVIAIMACASLLPKESQPLVPALQSYWLWIHVSLAALGEGAFAVAFAVSIMYLVQDVRQRRRPGAAPAGARLQATPAAASAPPLARGPGAAAGVPDEETPEEVDVEAGLRAERGPAAAVHAAAAGGEELPSLRLLDEINYRATTIGYPLYTIGALFAGAIWAYKAWGSFWSWDPKEVGALIIWLFYTAYLHARLQRAWAGRRAAWLSVAGFSMVILSFLGNLWLSGNHAYK